jgi:hypothetical protein
MLRLLLPLAASIAAGRIFMSPSWPSSSRVDNGNETECDRSPERSLKLRRLGEGACRTALERFHIQRFVADWNKVFAEATQ